MWGYGEVRAMPMPDAKRRALEGSACSDGREVERNAGSNPAHGHRVLRRVGIGCLLATVRPSEIARHLQGWTAPQQGCCKLKSLQSMAEACAARLRATSMGAPVGPYSLWTHRMAVGTPLDDMTDPLAPRP